MEKSFTYRPVGEPDILAWKKDGKEQREVWFARDKISEFEVMGNKTVIVLNSGTRIAVAMHVDTLKEKLYDNSLLNERGQIDLKPHTDASTLQNAIRQDFNCAAAAPGTVNIALCVSDYLDQSFYEVWFNSAHIKSIDKSAVKIGNSIVELHDGVFKEINPFYVAVDTAKLKAVIQAAIDSKLNRLNLSTETRTGKFPEQTPVYNALNAKPGNRTNGPRL